MSALASAEHWERLANEQESMAAFYDAHGRPNGDTSAYRFRASVYRAHGESAAHGGRDGQTALLNLLRRSPEPSAHAHGLAMNAIRKAAVAVFLALLAFVAVTIVIAWNVSVWRECRSEHSWGYCMRLISK